MDLLPLVFLFALMYFLLIRPQQQRAKAQRATIAALAVGDEVVTIGGVIGRVVRLDDEVAEVETMPGTVLRYRRSAISGRISPSTVADAATDEPTVIDDDRSENF